MALKATIFKATLQIADMDRNYYRNHALTLARHPSETDERMMVRLIAFALHADECLEFTRGLCVSDEPVLWRKDLTGKIELWLDVGLPDEDRLRRACGRSRQVVLFSYGGRSADVWWQRHAHKLNSLTNLQIINLPAAVTAELATLAHRTMQLHCSIQDGQICLGSSTATMIIEPEILKRAE